MSNFPKDFPPVLFSRLVKQGFALLLAFGFKGIISDRRNRTLRPTPHNAFVLKAIPTFLVLGASVCSLAASVLAQNNPTLAVTLTPASPLTNQTLTATPRVSGTSGDDLVYSYSFSLAGAVVQSGPSRTLDLSRAGQGDVGQSVEVSVTATDGATGAPSGLGAGTSSVTVANSAPVLENATLTASLNQLVSFSLDGRDADGDALSYVLTPVTGGSLPPGMALNGAGQLAGTPTQSGVFRFGLTVSDGRGAQKAARFALLVSDAADGQGLVFTRNEMPALLTRDQLANLTLSGTVRDTSPNGVTPSGVRRFLVQLRRISDNYAYAPDTGFAANLSRGYYAANLSAATSDTAEARTWNQEMSWVPPANQMAPGDYSILLYPQDNAGNYSVEYVTITIVEPPALPTGLTATAGDGQITLQWDAVPGATGYELFRSRTSGDYDLDNPVAVTASTSVTNTGLTNGTNYYYVVRAFSQAQQSGVSNEASAIPEKRLSIDAHLRADNTSAWLGEGFANADAQGQTLTGIIQSGETQTRQIRIKRNGGGQISKTVRVNVPDWAAFAGANWQARFFDAPQGGNDITSQITSNSGWTMTMSDGDSHIIRVEASAPTSFVARARGALTFRAATDETSETPAIDVVKAVWNTVTSNLQPDVAISVLDRNGVPGDYIGRGELSPTEQKVSAVLGTNEQRSFAVQIKNASDVSADFHLEQVTLPAGWSVKFYDALDSEQQLQSDNDGNIAIPSIEAGQSVTWKATVIVDGSAEQSNLPIRVSSDGLFDEVEINATLQKLVGLQWSRDGKTWADVTATTKLQAQRYQSLGFRAVKAMPGAEWPNDAFGPDWQWQGVKVKGEKVWLSPQRVTDGNGETATATLGADSFSITIVVLPDIDLYLEAARGVMVAGETVALTIVARDENAAPMPNARVRLRCTKDGAPSGHFGDAPSGEIFLLTDGQGHINTTWTAETPGRIQLSIEAVDSADEVFGEGDVWNMEVTN